MAEKEKTEKKVEAEREYIIPLRMALNRVPVYKRANKAVRTIKEFLVRHMKIRDGDLNKVKLDRYLNEHIWSRGIKKPPVKIKVKVRRDGENVIVELSEISEHSKFKKAKLEKRSQKASESGSKKKTKEVPEEKTEKTEEEKAEDNKEKEEKKASVVEVGREMEKQMGKKAKHNTQDQKKKQTTPHRMALQK